METCTNCGAQLRQGAKFCTTCGARQNPKSDGGDGWGDQPTQIIPALNPDLPDERSTNATEPEADSGWPSATPARSSDDPASRFISALESNMKPGDEDFTPLFDSEEQSEQSAPAEDTWRTAYAPAGSTNWNWSMPAEPATAPQSVDADMAEADVDPAEPVDGPAEPDVTVTEAEPAETMWSSWSTPAPDITTDNAGFTEGGNTEVDYLSGDENIEVSGPEKPMLVEDVIGESPETPMHLDPHPVVVPEHDLSPDDARAKAIALVDELRSVIRQMSGAEADAGNAAMTLTEATINPDSYDDVRDVLTSVAENPRDISALSDLAGKVDRLQALLADRDALIEKIEEALSDLTGN